MRIEPRVHVSAESAYDLEIATTLPERVRSGRYLLAGPVTSMGQNESVAALKSGGEVRPSSDGSERVRLSPKRPLIAWVIRPLNALTRDP